jgi:transcriptional regulator with XRE-family HTH domain
MDTTSLSLNGFQIVHFSKSGLLRERRITLGLTQQKVADRAKIPLQSYRDFEHGKRDIMRASFSIACRVIEALEMNISDFYHDEYMFGEKLCNSPEGLRYQKTGKLISEDVAE